MYENVIVPNDGSLEGRVVFAPAGDLAWRCRARVVQVSNTAVSDRSSKATVKRHAMSQSAADTEFWVDLENPLGEATIRAASFRPNPVICAASPRPAPKLMGRRRPSMSPLVAELVKRSHVPVVVIGPVTDTSRGLPMTELVVPIDGSPSVDGLLAAAAAWATSFKLGLVLTALTAGHEQLQRSQVEHDLNARAASLTVPAGVTVEPLRGDGGPADLVSMLGEHEDAVVMLASGPVGTAMGRSAADVILASPRAVVLAPG